MLKKRIKAVVIACVLVCILPKMSCAMDKEDFLEFLVNSSYPETKAKEDANNKNTNKQSDESNASSSENKAEKDYIKVHVGEENIPNINEATSAGGNNTQVSYGAYKNDIRVTKDKPRILIYHTHSCETYSNSPEGNYHSKDKENSVMEVGALLTEELTKLGWGVVHTTKYNDYPSYNGSYKTSLQTIQQIMPQYNSIDIAIDLHRDARDLTTPEMKENAEKRYTTTVNGERVAKFLFVVGGSNPNVEQVRGLAEGLTSYSQKKYPQMILPVVEKDYAKFNQYVAKNHILLEVGSNANSIEESKASAKYIADVLDGYFKQ